MHGIAYFGFANALSGQEDTIIFFEPNVFLAIFNMFILFGLLLMIHGR